MTTRIHHLNLCTLCPYGGVEDIACHALLVETARDGLVLVDTGMGLEDVQHPARRLGFGFVASMRPRLRDEDTAIRQVERLGFRPSDVRHLVLTHLDVDHAGGIPDFPDAAVHVHRAEHAAAMARSALKERERYRKVHFAHDPKWELHEADGERWLGFERVRAVAEDVLLIPLFGHTRGHCAVAVRAAPGAGATWLLHCGDGYFFEGELADPASCPFALRAFQRVIAIDNDARVANAARLRALHRDESARVRLFSAHSMSEFESMKRLSEAQALKEART